MMDIIDFLINEPRPCGMRPSRHNPVAYYGTHPIGIVIEEDQTGNAIILTRGQVQLFGEIYNIPEDLNGIEANIGFVALVR